MFKFLKKKKEENIVNVNNNVINNNNVIISMNYTQAKDLIVSTFHRLDYCQHLHLFLFKLRNWFPTHS